ncbi:hypothetical protein C9374_011556 [Naegleria lovaniensis]|uniref:Uncharacterized protein n=1 Tax=Naegleria lovaniensis TaxID=51637 RepID=A0AA88H4S7_NAELO|nr:uncharacterized protein C9374_011556 [Naegleria lovaniensis]KAG2392831.1 hypothetical protein C9374_011556 [Naegleria lovaniensis]
MLQNQSPFDELICANILLYTHPSGWLDMKPSLISKTFHRVLISETFHAQYIREVFGLVNFPNKERVLQQAIRLFGIEDDTNQNAKPPLGDKKKPKLKKRKTTPVKEEPLQRHIHSISDIFKYYVELCYEHGVPALRKKVNQLLLKYSKQTQENHDLTILEQISNLIEMERFSHVLCAKFEEMFTNGMNLDNRTGPQISISASILKDLFGGQYGFKEVFVRKLQDSKSEWENNFRVEFTLFLECGYPLDIICDFKHERQTYDFCYSFRKQVCIQNTMKTVFTHNYNVQVEGERDGDGWYSDHLLRNLKSVLFLNLESEEIQNLLVSNFKDPNQREQCFNSILGEFLQAAFVEHELPYNSAAELQCVRGLPTLLNA